MNMKDRITDVCKKIGKYIYAKKWIAIFMCFVIVVSLVSCHLQQGDKTDNMITRVEDSKEPKINLTTIDSADDSIKDAEDLSSDTENKKNESTVQEIDINETDDVFSVVCSSLSRALEDAGFSAHCGIARSETNQSESKLGVYFYSDDIKLYDNDDLNAVGFLEVVEKNKDDGIEFDQNKLIYITPTEQSEIDKETELINTYYYEDIQPNHFVYNNQYITYYQSTKTKVVYEVKDNNSDLYDISYGSLYDYDNLEYIYDETIFDEYVTHPAVPFFKEEDYQKLEQLLKQMSIEQENAGFYVEEYNILYISPENIQTYLDSKESDTFFGYDVDQLTEAFGQGVALELTSEGLAKADIDVNAENYDWKSFLTKVGVGVGILIVGAVLSPVTGGASFGCALVCMTKIAVGASMCAALGTLAVETAKGLFEGKSIIESLYSASFKGLDQFANTFLIMSAVASAGVLSGAINPTACFAADTKVAVYEDGRIISKDIQDIHVGEWVMTYNQERAIIEPQKVYSTYCRLTDELQRLHYDVDSTIYTTPLHSIYLSNYDSWTQAKDISVGDEMMLLKGETTIVNSNQTLTVKAVPVYNLAVEKNHNYFVGEKAVLVHNMCESTLKYKRRQAVDKAWEKEVEAVKNGTSKYNWTKKQIKELLTNGKIDGFEGHHIIPVNELNNTARESLISDPDNIVFLAKEAHTYLHKFGDSFEATKDVLVELVPWVAEKIVLLGA